jgi:hypothetical protein
MIASWTFGILSCLFVLFAALLYRSGSGTDDFGAGISALVCLVLALVFGICWIMALNA